MRRARTWLNTEKYLESAKLFDKTKLYDPQEAFELVCKAAKAKFDETIEVHVRLGVDSRHADQQVRGAVVPQRNRQKCPGAGVCQGDKAEGAKEAGADYVGEAELVEKITKKLV